MPTLRDQLIKILPEVLPKTSDKPINGTRLIEKVSSRLDGDYAEASLRQHFSVLSGEPTSPIARVDQGHGYYLRPSADLVQAPTETPLCEGSQAPETEAYAGRNEQREEKFRALFLRWGKLNNQFPMQIEHTRGNRQKAGINKWKFPDVVVLRWEVGEVTDRGFRLEKDLLEVKKSLGEQPFHLTSIELKVELSASTLREAFFQCVSNSKWAHAAQLTVACKIADELVAEELRRLGASYDVSVVSFGLELGQLDSLPAADILLKSLDGEIEQHVSKIAVTRLSPGRDRDNLDWEHVRDLRAQSPDINDLFRWIAFCLEKKAPYTVDHWRSISTVENNYD